MRFLNKKLFLTTFWFFLFLFCLRFNKLCQICIIRGLINWYQNILPFLFPFMVLTSLLSLLNLEQFFSRLCSPILFPYFHFTNYAKSIIFLGNLCGFPIGANLVASHYQKGHFSLQEANYLLCFSNQLSPAFFFGICIPALNQFYDTTDKKNFLLFFFSFYLVPLLYGFILQFFLDPIDKKYSTTMSFENNITLYPVLPFSKAINESIIHAIQILLRLAAYIVLFQILSTIPITIFTILSQHHISKMTSLLSPNIISEINIFITMLLEITNGITFFKVHTISYQKIYISLFFFCLHFGGLSCLLQTSCFLEKTDISLKKYIFHKSIQGLLAGFIIFLFL